MKFFKFSMIVVICLLLSGSASASGDSKVKWYDYKTGMEQAKDQDKLVYMMFHSDSCTYCKMMDETTFSDSEVADYLNDKFIPVQVNGDKDRLIASQYKVRAYPSSFFLKSNSDVIGFKMGYMDIKNFMKLIDFVNTEYSNE